MTTYADNPSLLGEGYAFLVEVYRPGKGSYFCVQRTPLHTNMRPYPLLSGWAGETNNVVRYARGVVRIVKVFANNRVRCARVVGEAAEVALRRLGYETSEEVRSGDEVQVRLRRA